MCGGCKMSPITSSLCSYIFSGPIQFKSKHVFDQVNKVKMWSPRRNDPRKTQNQSPQLEPQEQESIKWRRIYHIPIKT